MEPRKSRFMHAFRYAWEGIRYMVRTQPNAQVHMGIALLVLIAGFLLGVSRLEWIIIILVVGLVLAAEALNSAIEKVVDLASPGQHELAKRAKDLGAGAVLITAITAALAGLLIFVPRLLACITVP